MSDRLLAAIEAVQRELAKGTPGPWYQNYEQDGETDGNGTVYLDDTVSPTGELYHVNEYIGHIVHTTDANNIAALLNAAPGMLEAARRCIENSQLVLSYQTRDDVYTAVRAMLTPLFAQFAHLPEVQELEGKE